MPQIILHIQNEPAVIGEVDELAENFQIRWSEFAIQPVRMEKNWIIWTSVRIMLFGRWNG